MKLEMPFRLRHKMIEKVLRRAIPEKMFYCKPESTKEQQQKWVMLPEGEFMYAILVQAVTDSMLEKWHSYDDEGLGQESYGPEEARDWIASSACAGLCERLGLNHDYVLALMRDHVWVQ